MAATRSSAFTEGAFDRSEQCAVRPRTERASAARPRPPAVPGREGPRGALGVRSPVRVAGSPARPRRTAAPARLARVAAQDPAASPDGPVDATGEDPRPARSDLKFVGRRFDSGGWLLVALRHPSKPCRARNDRESWTLDAPGRSPRSRRGLECAHGVTGCRSPSGRRPRWRLIPARDSRILDEALSVPTSGPSAQVWTRGSAGMLRVHGRVRLAWTASADAASAPGDCPGSVREHAPPPAETNQERAGNVLKLSEVTGASWSLSLASAGFESPASASSATSANRRINYSRWPHRLVQPQNRGIVQ